jgi:hypothetical protein
LKNTVMNKLICALGLALVGTVASAQTASNEKSADAGEMEVGTSFDFTSGTYGGNAKVEELSVPLILFYKTGRMSYKLSVPYLIVRGPSDVVPIDSGSIICNDRSGRGGGSNSGPGSSSDSLDDCDDDASTEAERTTRSGLGDVQVEIAYDVPEFMQDGPTLALIGKIKLGTASASKGLGTGKNSDSLQADVAKQFGSFAALSGVGYRVYQRLVGTTLKNTPFVSLGGSWQINESTGIKLVYDRRWPVEAGALHAAELTATLSRALDKDWRMEAYLLNGLTDASADLAAGLVIARKF